MIRFLHCVKRRPELSPEEFRRRWNDPAFGDLIDQVAAATGAIRVERNLTLIIEQNVELMLERGSAEPFDATLEVWWESGQSLNALSNSPAFEAMLDAMTEQQRQFIDFSASRRFFTEWGNPAP